MFTLNKEGENSVPQPTEPNLGEKIEHLYLVDASGFIFRAFHAVQLLNRPEGTPVNAVYGFITMLMKVLDDMQPDHVAIIWYCQLNEN